MKVFSKEKLEELKKVVDIEDVCKILRFENCDRVNRYDCPFCESPSFVLNSYGKPDRFYCFSCEAKGDSAILLMLTRKLSFADSIKFLSVLFNVDVNRKKEEEEEEEEEEISLKIIADLKKTIKCNSISEDEALIIAKAISIAKEHIKD